LSEVVVIASFLAQEGKEAAAKQFFADLLEETHGEDGCLLYALHQGTEDSTRFAFVERWESPELLAKHLASDHIQTALAAVGEYCSAEPDIVYYEAIDGGTKSAGSIAGHAAGN
jgi:quinol monooxygenase YgiN